MPQPGYPRYLQAEQALNEGLIRSGLPPRPADQIAWHREQRMAEMCAFLQQCGNPQDAFAAVHVTGTSGKGSVATGVAHGLAALGLRVGLHVSPYLQSATEKIWIDGRLLDADTFADVVDAVMPIALPWRKPETHASIHGMASVAVAFEAFRRARVDVAVIEAGCGGRFDLTNVLNSIVTVVTSVGYDHLVALGPTLADIAWHKVGIFRPGVPAVVCMPQDLLPIARQQAAALHAPLTELPVCDAPFPLRNRELALAVVALAAPQLGHAAILDRLAALRPVLAQARQPGRLERMPGPLPVFLDGAHNPDKAAAMLTALNVLPEASRRPRVVVVGVISHKDAAGVLGRVLDFADVVVVSQPRVYEKPPQPAEALARLCQARCAEVHVCREPEAALQLALRRAAPDGMVLVTGSFYLVGAVRDVYFPREQVVLQRTSWPTAT